MLLAPSSLPYPKLVASFRWRFHAAELSPLTPHFPPSPSQESLSTLKFANRAKNIKNEAHVNEDLDQRTLLRKWVQGWAAVGTV